MRILALALPLMLAAATHADSSRADGVETFVRNALKTASYRRADADLNGDGRKESFVYVFDAGLCGSGGCVLLVLSPHGSSYKVVMRTTVTWPPIAVLATSSHGWRDIGVTVQGGGKVRPYMARLRYNGQRYPSNPTVPPARQLGRPSGTVLLGR